MLLLCKRYEHFKEKNVYIKLADRPQCFRRSCFGFFLGFSLQVFILSAELVKIHHFLSFLSFVHLLMKENADMLIKHLWQLNIMKTWRHGILKLILCVMRLKTKCVSFQRPPCIRQCLFVSGFGWFRSEIISMQLASFLSQYCEGLTIHTDIR